MAGEYEEFVDSSNVSLTNQTSGDVFTQLYNLQINIDSVVTKRIKTDSKILKFFDPIDFTVDADIYLTEPEAITWANLTTQTNNLPSAQSFSISYTGDNGNVTTQTGTFRVASLRFITPEEGHVNYHIRLESVDGDVATT